MNLMMLNIVQSFDFRHYKFNANFQENQQITFQLAYTTHTYTTYTTNTHAHSFSESAEFLFVCFFLFLPLFFFFFAFVVYASFFQRKMHYKISTKLLCHKFPLLCVYSICDCLLLILFCQLLEGKKRKIIYLLLNYRFIAVH